MTFIIPMNWLEMKKIINDKIMVVYISSYGFFFFQAEQIQLMNTEIQNLTLSMKILQEENRRLRQTNESNEYETQVKLR